MARHERSAERERHWRGVLRRFGQSGLSVREFCGREAVPESAFYFWRRTLRERDAKPAAVSVPALRPATPAFLPLAVERRGVVGPAAELAIELGVGLTLRCPESVSVERIVAIVRALREEAQA